MNQLAEQEFRFKCRPRLLEYISKTSILESSDKVKCPICGDKDCRITADYLWHCTKDRSHSGDIVDYAYHQYKCKDYDKAAQIVQHVLNSKISFLNCITSSDLMDKEFPDTSQYLIENVMGKGLYMLSGAPKIGKSWLVLWLADRISKGLSVWDFATQKSGVLYISLEDTLQRLQARLCDISSGDNSNLMITTDSCVLGDGFEEQLGRYLCEFPDTGLIIIDTLQRIRKSTNQYNYGEDYDVMNSLKRIADKHNTTILLVHHNRKMDGNDPIENISGTAGLSGAVDGMLILKRKYRGQSEATLYITGRDIADSTISLAFNKDTKVWERLPGSDDNDVSEDKDPVIDKIASLLDKQPSWTGTASELIKVLNMAEDKPNSISRRLNCKKGYLLQKYGIEYSSTRTSDSRIINLSR